MARPRSISDTEIHCAAREVFVHHGPNAPVALIAKKLGVSHAVLFGRVGTKGQLLFDDLCPGRPPAVERFAEFPPYGRARETLVEVLTEFMAFFRHAVPNLVVPRAAGRSMADMPPCGDRPPPVALRWSLARWLERAIERGELPPGPLVGRRRGTPRGDGSPLLQRPPRRRGLRTRERRRVRSRAGRRADGERPKSAILVAARRSPHQHITLTFGSADQMTGVTGVFSFTKALHRTRQQALDAEAE